MRQLSFILSLLLLYSRSFVRSFNIHMRRRSSIRAVWHCTVQFDYIFGTAIFHSLLLNIFHTLAALFLSCPNLWNSIQTIESTAMCSYWLTLLLLFSYSLFEGEILRPQIFCCVLLNVWTFTHVERILKFDFRQWRSGRKRNGERLQALNLSMENVLRSTSICQLYCCVCMYMCVCIWMSDCISYILIV